MSDIEKTRCGYVAVVGRPNVGKSTLMNAFLEQKVAAVSPKAQTTRRRQLGILTLENTQIIFVDTPGLHVPQHKLGDFMNQEAMEGLLDADLVLWLIDASVPLTEEDHLIAERLNAIKRKLKVVLVLSKCDLADSATLETRTRAALALYPARQVLAISATTRTGLGELMSTILKALPEGEFFFDADTVTDYYERDIAAELIRESVMDSVRDEVPHCIAVRLDSYRETAEDKASIEGTIFVERDSQKGILIGQGGAMIKQIGTHARHEIEAMSGRKVYLDLRVKVNKNWRNSPEALRLLGYESFKEK